MNDQISCNECKHSIAELGYKCIGCSNFFQAEIFYCKRCFEHIKHEQLKHEVVPINNTTTTNDRLIHSIIDLEKLHLSTTLDQSKLFPYNDQGSIVWKNNQFLEISYQLPSAMPLKNSIPFVCDYLRMNNSLEDLANKLNLKLCSTDIIILILKYSSFNVRLFIIEQLCTFQRAIPIYFGVPILEDSSMKSYFLMHEMLHMLLPYRYQNIPFLLSFGTSSCKGKTSLLNALIKTNFDCHSKAQFNFQTSSIYYQNQLIQMILGHQYGTDKNDNNEVTRRYRCHILDLHGNHQWNKMPNFFMEFMSGTIIHMDQCDLDQIDSLPWPFVTHNQTAIYFIFIHGEISDSDIRTKLQAQIKNKFGLNQENVHVYRANAILTENDRTLQSGILDLLRKACIPAKSLLDVSEELVSRYELNLSINASALLDNKQLLNEFYIILNKLPPDDPFYDLFPLSRLKELSEKSFLSPNDEQQKTQLIKRLHSGKFNQAHILLTKLAELSVNDANQMIDFEKAVLLCNSILWQRNRNKAQQSSISKLSHLEMDKERFLHEFQERSKEYKNLNGVSCLFKDMNQIREALIKIYRHSFQNQEYVEVINATSSITYPDIFNQTFSNDTNDLRGFFVIGIIGEQSSGKSFLVNKTFGTKIAESKFKSTTGILATQVRITGHERVKNLVILDTEGLLDQSKKDTEAQIFDRKMVLAVMARSHVVLVNINRNVNKIMQQILEVVIYGLNKLRITTKPKLVFLFRDQDPRTMGEAGQRNHVKEVMDTINRDCNQADFNMQNIIDGFDIHEFPSPFVDLLVGEREITFFNNSFCEKALSLRLKVIDHLASLQPFDSFNEWLRLMFEQWLQINQNSNLFDFESLIHLTLERDLEIFCNHVLTDANCQIRSTVDNLKKTGKNQSEGMMIIHDIEQKLLREQERLIHDLYERLSGERQNLIRKYKLDAFPENLYENTKSRIKSSLDLYKIENFMVATRQFQQDELQQKLSEIPKELSIKIREIQNVSENTAQFETLFNNASKILLTNFIQMLENDSRKQSVPLNNQLIQNFLDRNRIDAVGVRYFQQHICNPALVDVVRKVVCEENSHNNNERSIVPRTPDITPGNQHGLGIFRRFALWIEDTFFRNKKTNIDAESEFEKMLSFLKIEYTALQTSPFYKSNFLPIPEVANYCVERIREAIKNNKIERQDERNMWYTCYGIMLNLFCDDHYQHINKKLITEFEQEISRRKEEVRQSIVNATTAEEHGQALIKQMWTIIQNGIQRQFQDQFERFFDTWDHYRPTIIAKNCVNELFRSNDYQAMFDYIKDPTAYIKDWLRLRFHDKYDSQLAETILHLSLNLDYNKKKFSRMILTWHNAIQAFKSDESVSYLIISLKEFLINGQYENDGISLLETEGGFSMLDSASIREIPETADPHRLLRAIRSISQTSLDDTNQCVKESTKELINNEQLKNRLFDQFYNKAKGCGTPCPYCKQICNNDNPLHTQHRTDYHLLWVFAGYRSIDTEKPSLACCTTNEAFERRIRSSVDKDTYISFPEHLKRFNPTWTIINEMTSLEDFLLKAYIALEEELAKYYQFEGRADMTVRKKYIRAIVTTHCYGLLIGIDYENTPYSLDGIPSKDVLCIQQQLIHSSIAYSEKLSVLKNGEATKQKIIDTLNQIVNNMDQRSTFIFYFSGHGGQSSTSSSDLLTADDETITAKELVAVLRRAQTNKMILIFDSCYSGGMGKAFRFDAKNYKEGIHILCSCRPTEAAYQFEEDDNGFFTKHLIKGLKGEFSCELNGCRQCAERTKSLQEAPIHTVTSTELVTYLNHAVTGHQQFSLTTINGCDFDISFLDY